MGKHSMLVLPLFLLSLCSHSWARLDEQFNEELSLRPLPDGRVASRFAFKTLLKGASPRNPATLGSGDESQHYTLFPLALGQILREYAITELHLTLNAGNWDYDRWGIPEEQGIATGAELWAWMGDGASTSVDERWNGLRNALAGLFCASLGSMDEKQTTAPGLSFSPEGILPDWGTGPHAIRHASLPSEHVCTENLTPLLKLLPCKSLSGIASLLNPHRVFDADWHGMGVHVLWRSEGIEVRLTFQSVSDPLRISKSNKRDWSFQTLFDRTVERACPVAQSSRVLVTSHEHPSDAYTLFPDPTSQDASFVGYDVNTATKPLNVEMTWAGNFQYPIQDKSQSFISVRRKLTSSSQVRGKLELLIQNHQDTTQHVLYLETMPWIVQFYLHTLKAYINNVDTGEIINNITYIPAVPHSRPTTLQSVLVLPPNCTVQISMVITKAFLRYTEHPPDAQRGWDLPPAVFTIIGGEYGNTLLDEKKNAKVPRRLYTSTLLVDLATPDFSMPYNVIVFTCTVIAYVFGNVFNLLTRKVVLVHIPDGEAEKEGGEEAVDKERGKKEE
ncbi:GPI transamidase component GPI16 [Cyathus striatus]|nr:GPI transamidase component GPI16 [Cyathus striatus]